MSLRQSMLGPSQYEINIQLTLGYLLGSKVSSESHSRLSSSQLPSHPSQQATPLKAHYNYFLHTVKMARATTTRRSKTQKPPPTNPKSVFIFPAILLLLATLTVGAIFYRDPSRATMVLLHISTRFISWALLLLTNLNAHLLAMMPAMHNTIQSSPRIFPSRKEIGDGILL